MKLHYSKISGACEQVLWMPWQPIYSEIENLVKGVGNENAHQMWLITKDEIKNVKQAKHTVIPYAEVFKVLPPSLRCYKM